MAAKHLCVQQHCETTKDQKNLHLQAMKQNRKRKLSFGIPETSPSQFHRDLYEMLISANIPPNKVSNKQFINFMRKYTNKLSN
jgi:hypothetical protein